MLVKYDVRLRWCNVAWWSFVWGLLTYLLSWSLLQTEALKFVVSILRVQILIPMMANFFGILGEKNISPEMITLHWHCDWKCWNCKSYYAVYNSYSQFKRTAFWSYLHVAVKYGQLKIFKILIEHLQDKSFDWLKFKDKEGRSVYDLLKDENIQIDITTSWGCWKHPFGIPGVRLMFLKPKLH